MTKKDSALFLFMLLLIAAGALLPRGIAALDSSSLENRVDTRPLPGIHLDLRPERSVEDTLSIWSRANSKIALGPGDERSQQEARAVLEAVIELLLERGLLPKCFFDAKLDSTYSLAVISDSGTAAAGNPDVTSSTAVPDSEASDAAVVWCGSTAEPDPYLLLYVDDATGKLISISYDISEWGELELANVRDLINQWAEFLVEYYGLSDLRTESHLTVTQSSVRCDWELFWIWDGREITCPVTLIQQGNRVTVNL